MLVGLAIVGTALGWPASAAGPNLPEQKHPDRSREITARTFQVERIVDGDTFKVAYDGELTSVRPIGIDAPERNTPEGPAATAALAKLIEGKTVRLEFPGPRKRDNFGRLLCEVYLDVGAEMMRLGQAKAYVPKR